MTAPVLTPAARKVVEAVHAGAVLTMHYRRGDDGANEHRFVLEPAGVGVIAPTAILAIRSKCLAPIGGSLFEEPGMDVPQIWGKGCPVPALPPSCIPGTKVRDTAIPGLTVRFTGKRSDRGEVMHASSGCLLLTENDMPCGKREFVRRVDGSRLSEGDWTLDIETLKVSKNDLYMPLVRSAREQIWGRK